MVGSTAAPPPSSHPDRPAGIVDGEAFPPPPDGPPSPTATGVLLPSSVQISAQDHLQLQDRLIRVKVEEVSEDGNVQTQGGVGGALQGRKKGATMTPGKCSKDGNVHTQGVSLPSTSARPRSSMRPSLSSKNKGSQPAANDNLQAQQKRPANAVPKMRLKTPILPVVGSPGVNHMLSQESPRTIGVKRSTPTSQLSGPE